MSLGVNDIWPLPYCGPWPVILSFWALESSVKIDMTENDAESPFSGCYEDQGRKTERS